MIFTRSSVFLASSMSTAAFSRSARIPAMSGLESATSGSPAFTGVAELDEHARHAAGERRADARGLGLVDAEARADRLAPVRRPRGVAGASFSAFHCGSSAGSDEGATPGVTALRSFAGASCDDRAQRIPANATTPTIPTITAVRDANHGRAGSGASTRGRPGERSWVGSSS